MGMHGWEVSHALSEDVARLRDELETERERVQQWQNDYYDLVEAHDTLYLALEKACEELSLISYDVTMPPRNVSAEDFRNRFIAEVESRE